MAGIKFSALVQEARGKLNGSVLSKNKGGNYMRNKTTPVNPNTAAQAAVRNNLTYIAQAWRGLTQQQRDGWSGVTEQYQRTNIFGDKTKLSGSQLFSRLNLNLLTVGEPDITDAPLPTNIASIDSISATAAASPASFSLTFSPAIDTDTKMILRASPGMSPGISNAKNKMRIIGYLDDTNTSPFNALAMYQAKFGSIPPAGSKIFFDMEPVNKTTGVDGIALSGYLIVT